MSRANTTGIPIDALGRELKVGDKIAYAVGAGHSQILNFYEIDKITPKTGKFWDDEERDHIEGFAFSIRARYLGGHAWRFGKPKEFSTLFFPGERSLLLPPDTVVPSPRIFDV